MALMLLLVLPCCSQTTSKPITEVSQNDLNSGILLDVRTPEEYSAGHLQGARNINWLSADFLEAADSLPKDKTLYIYCQKGGRSAKASHALDSLGYQVINLSGGCAAWRAKNP